MTAFRIDRVTRDGGVAESPAAMRAARIGAGRVGRGAAAVYGWLAGPAVTGLERERAALAAARNFPGRRGPFI